MITGPTLSGLGPGTTVLSLAPHLPWSLPPSQLASNYLIYYSTWLNAVFVLCLHLHLRTLTYIRSQCFAEFTNPTPNPKWLHSTLQPLTLTLNLTLTLTLTLSGCTVPYSP